MNDNWIENELDAPPLADGNCVACLLPFMWWQRVTESDAGAGPLHGACNPDAAERTRADLFGGTGRL